MTPRALAMRLSEWMDEWDEVRGVTKPGLAYFLALKLLGEQLVVSKEQ